jgi:hypothetical protein
MCAVPYQRTATAIKGAFVHFCFVCCCPGSCWGNTEQVVTQWQCPVASGIALDMMHQAMSFALHRPSARPSKLAVTEDHFDAIINFVIDNNRS